MDLGTALRPQWVGSGRGRSPFDLYPSPVFIEAGRAYSQVRLIRPQLRESSFISRHLEREPQMNLNQVRAHFNC